MDSKKSKSAYPDFRELVKFVSEMASEANDPVYGYYVCTFGTSNVQTSLGPGSIGFHLALPWLCLIRGLKQTGSLLIILGL